MERRELLKIGGGIFAGLALSACETTLTPAEQERIFASLASPVPENESQGIIRRTRRIRIKNKFLDIPEIIYQPVDDGAAEKTGIPFYAVTGGTLGMINVEFKTSDGMIVQLLPGEHFAIINEDLTLLYTCAYNQIFPRFKENSLVGVKKGEQLGILKEPTFCPRGWHCDTFNEELQPIMESWLFIQIFRNPQY